MRKYYTLIILFFAGLIWSGIRPHDYFTWIMEVFPAILGFLVLILTFRKFRFSTLTYSLILMHCYILFIGGHYTYAEVPLFNWIRDVLHQSRNNYDKIGHFTQGFVPAFIVRELFIRLQIVQKKYWLSFLTVCVCMTISVLYEFLEWFVAVASGQSADAFLGTQGYVWDTQSDMLFATIGAVVMVLLFSGLQDKRISFLNSSANPQRTLREPVLKA
jgi:putative membrane protein